MSDLLGLDEPRPQSPVDPNAPPPVVEPDPALYARAKRGANWFYWIAALSVVNAGVFIAGGNFHFLAGLGITELADGIIDASIQQGAPAAIKAVAIVFDVVAVVVFALLGYFSNKLLQPAFIIGIVIYVVDGLIVLLLGALLMAGFHAFALFGIITGFLACREIKAIRKANAPSILPTPPPPPNFA